MNLPELISLKGFCDRYHIEIWAYPEVRQEYRFRCQVILIIDYWDAKNGYITPGDVENTLRVLFGNVGLL